MDETILLILIVFVALLLFITILVFIVYSGLLHDVDIGAGKPPISDAKVYYKSGEGSYKDVGFVFSDVTSIAPKHKSFAVYYDDPIKIATKERWAVGVILAEGSEEMDPLLKDAFTKEGYKPFKFPKVQNVVTTTFPNTCSLSSIFAKYRVYPQLAYYVKENKLCAHPWIEIYDGDIINYMVPLAKQEEFYVPECVSAKQDTRGRKQRKRQHEADACETKEEDSEVSDLEPNGTINTECVPVIECEHSYATSPKSESIRLNSKAQQDQSVNSAGELIASSQTVNNGHNIRSKSVNVLGPKTDRLRDVLQISKLRSASTIPQNMTPQLAVSNPLVPSEFTKESTRKKVDRDTGNYSMDPSEDGFNSSASSISSSGDTIESSLFTSEYSYSSVGSNTSHNTSRYSCDSDKTF